MIKNCVRCNKVGLWFQFYTSFEGLYTWAPDICKVCAGDLQNQAVSEYMESTKTTPIRGE